MLSSASVVANMFTIPNYNPFMQEALDFACKTKPCLQESPGPLLALLGRLCYLYIISAVGTGLFTLDQIHPECKCTDFCEVTPIMNLVSYLWDMT